MGAIAGQKVITTYNVNGADATFTGSINGKSLLVNGNTFDLDTTFEQGSILYASSANTLTKLTKGTEDQVLTVNGNILSWQDASGSSTAGGADTQFQFNDGGTTLSGNGALTFTKASKTITVATDAPLDINSTSLSIADPDITFDGATTTFTQSTGAFTFSPASGSSVNYSLATTGDFIVTTDDLVVDTSADRVGIQTNTPAATLDVGGGTLTSIDGTDDLLVKDDIEVDGSAYINGAILNSGFISNTSSTAVTVNWNTGNRQKITLGHNVAFTFTNPTSGVGSFSLILTQDGTGNRVVSSWPASVKWPSGVEPTLSTTANAIDVISCLYDGSNYLCQTGLDFQ